MAVDVIMPKQGLQMTEGTIISWMASEGDSVQEATRSSRSRPTNSP